jgi:hypothetical protein
VFLRVLVLRVLVLRVLVLRVLVFGASGLAYCIGQRLEVVAARAEHRWVGGQPDDLPAPRGREAFAVHLTQVVAVWFSVRR